MSGDGFQVDLEALRGLAARLEQAADQLGQEIALFARSSQGVGADPFGPLPGARAAHRAYLEKAEEALRGLRAVQATLAADLDSASPPGFASSGHASESASIAAAGATSCSSNAEARITSALVRDCGLTA